MKCERCGEPVEGLTSADALQEFVSALAEEGRIEWRDDAPIFWDLIENVREAIAEKESDESIRPSDRIGQRK